MIKIVLNDQTEVIIDDFSFHRTYAGLIEGQPSEWLNRRILSRLIPRYSLEDDDSSPYLIPVDENLVKTELPEWYLVCNARSRIPKTNEDDGSGLTIIGFVSGVIIENESIPYVLQHVIQGVDWNSFSVGWNF